MKILLLAFCLLFAGLGQAQPLMVNDTLGSVVVKKDPRLDILSQKQIEINHRALVRNTTHVTGYRIQVINTQSRDEANNVKGEMLRRFPDQKAYLMYKAPYFKVRMGNFLSKNDAEPYRKMISNLYPSRGIYLVSDNVENKPPEEDLYGVD